MMKTQTKLKNTIMHDLVRRVANEMGHPELEYKFWLDIVGEPPDEWLKRKVDPTFKNILTVTRTPLNDFMVVCDINIGPVPQGYEKLQFGDVINKVLMQILKNRAYVEIKEIEPIETEGNKHANKYPDDRQ